MMRHLLAAIGLLLALAAAPVSAQEVFTPAQRAAIREMLIETLRERPELVLEALQSLEKRHEAEAQAQAQAALRTRKSELFDDPQSPLAGNPQGRIAVVEFFDYRCPYCKQMAAPLKELLAGASDVRIIRKDLPILGPASVVAARAALAARVQGKYAPLHDALIGYRGQLDEAAIFRIAGEVGLNITKLRTDMDAPEITALLQRNMGLAQALNISGTPAFVIGETLLPGAIDLATLRNLVAEARKAP